MSNAVKGWFRQWLFDYRKEKYTVNMLYYRKIAEYNLHRHNEAVENYNQKRNNRSSSFSKAINVQMGFFIADEGADITARNYNDNWDLYIKYKHKLEVLDYENELLKLTANNTNTEIL